MAFGCGLGCGKARKDEVERAKRRYRKEYGEYWPVEWRCGYEWSSLYPIDDIKLMVPFIDGWKYYEQLS